MTITENTSIVRLLVNGTEIEIDGKSPITIKVNSSDLPKIQQNVIRI